MARSEQEITGPKLSIWERFPELNKIPKDGFPNHVLIIPDRNRTYASLVLHAPPIFGHKKGAEALEKGLLDLWELPIPNISIWGASEDNITERKSKDIDDLLQLERDMIKKNLDNMQNHGILLIHEGRKDRLPENLLATIKNAEDLTQHNFKKTLRLLIDYGETYRQKKYDERLVQAVIDRGYPRGTIVTDTLMDNFKMFDVMPSVDCVVRTVGKKSDLDFFWTSGIGRIADHATWIPIYKYFPEVITEDFIRALIAYSQIEKRNGGDSKKTQKGESKI